MSIIKVPSLYLTESPEIANIKASYQKLLMARKNVDDHLLQEDVSKNVVKALLHKQLEVQIEWPWKIVKWGHIFIYLCNASLISFEIDCFYSLNTCPPTQRSSAAHAQTKLQELNDSKVVDHNNYGIFPCNFMAGFAHIFSQG